MRTDFTEADVAAFAPSEKIGIVATLDGDGEPHLSILTTIMARGARGLTIGEFSRGRSKANLAERRKAGFLVMGLDRRLWRGKASWQALAKEGAEYEAYNRQPMFRYNTYFGVNTVHYLDLVGVEGPSPLPMGAIVAGSVATALRAPLAGRGAPAAAVLPPFALSILDALGSLNFLAVVEADGYPRIIPVVQARSAGPSRVVWTPSAWREELLALEEGQRAALLSMNLSMESFVARGALRRPTKGLMALDLDWLYNSAPPCHGQVYPRPALAPLRLA
jgi:hypothetical protein